MNAFSVLRTHGSSACAYVYIYLCSCDVECTRGVRFAPDHGDDAGLYSRRSDAKASSSIHPYLPSFLQDHTPRTVTKYPLLNFVPGRIPCLTYFPSGHFDAAIRRVRSDRSQPKSQRRSRNHAREKFLMNDRRDLILRQ